MNPVSTPARTSEKAADFVDGAVFPQKEARYSPDKNRSRGSFSQPINSGTTYKDYNTEGQKNIAHAPNYGTGNPRKVS